MEYKAKLNFKFYLTTVLQGAATVMVCWMFYEFLTTRIMVGDNEYMPAGEQSVFTAIIGIIALTWLFSFIILLRQAFRGYAFLADENGIHNTLTLKIVFAAIFVVPVDISYSAIESKGKFIKSTHGSITQLNLDKKKMGVSAFLRPFASSEYHLCVGYTADKENFIEEVLGTFPGYAALPTKANDEE